MGYRTRAIISRGLYIFYPILYCGLYCRAVSNTDNLCTKQGNSSIFGPKIHGLKSRAVILACVRYLPVINCAKKLGTGYFEKE